MILIISSEDSESLDESFEELTVRSTFSECFMVVLIDNGDVLIDLSALILGIVILVISVISESLDEDFEGLAVFLLKDLVKSLTIFFEDEDLVELSCISVES